MSFDPVPIAQAKVLLVLARMDRPTLPAVTEATGLAYRTAYDALRALRDVGMVTWEGGKKGTMRATFECRWPS